MECWYVSCNKTERKYVFENYERHLPQSWPLAHIQWLCTLQPLTRRKTGYLQARYPCIFHELAASVNPLPPKHSYWSYSVVRKSEIKSEDPGFDPLAWQGEGQSFRLSESNSQILCRPVRARPPSCVRHAPRLVSTLKITSICRKRLGPIAGGMFTENSCIR